MHTLAIYGGSFDPLHNGHLKTAQNVQNEFKFDRLVFLPCKSPVLKENTKATAEQRISMLKLGLIRYPSFSVDLREVSRAGPSYMVDTLESIRDEVGLETAIILILGMDAFKQLPKWHHWEKILQLCHILVLQRPQTSSEINQKPLKSVVKQNQTFNKTDLYNCAFGKIYYFNAGYYDISSTWIRKQIKEGRDIESYLPAPVLSYIRENKLYQ